MSDVQAAAPRPLARPRPSDPVTDRRLARVHLRMGLLGLARAELEALAGGDELDDEGLVALAEARWRTGDLSGAGEAAQAHLAAHPDGGDDLVAIVIAAEATAALGRPGEARRLAARAMERADASLDRIFGGMPRSQVWPADPSEAGQHAGTLFPEARVVRAAPVAAPAYADDIEPSAATDEPGLWDHADGAPALPEPADALDAAEEALDEGDLVTAAVYLALVLRVGPALAPAVLDAAGRATEPSPELDIVRGDAFRLVGHEADAQRAFASAAAASAHRRRTRAHSPEEP
jgi:hypothetical protein